MDVKNFASQNALPIVALFTLLAIGASAITISALKGVTGNSFTAFEFIGVLPAAFLGPFFGIITIVIAKAASVIILSQPLDLTTLLRFLPPIFAAYFFATYKKENKGSGTMQPAIPHSRIIQIAVPLACIALFIAHPIGSQAWLFSLYWLIPPILAILPQEHLFLRSLGTTFTQHAIGGVIWIYFVNPLTPAAWLALIPIVAGERLLFAAGMSASYVAINAALSRVSYLAHSRYIKIAPLPFAKKKN